MWRSPLLLKAQLNRPAYQQDFLDVEIRRCRDREDQPRSWLKHSTDLSEISYILSSTASRPLLPVRKFRHQKRPIINGGRSTNFISGIFYDHLEGCGQNRICDLSTVCLKVDHLRSQLSFSLPPDRQGFMPACYDIPRR